MCYPKPGPRCSQHALRAFEKALAACGQDRNITNYRARAIASADFQLTPAGIAAVKEGWDKNEHLRALRQEVRSVDGKLVRPSYERQLRELGFNKPRPERAKQLQELRASKLARLAAGTSQNDSGATKEYQRTADGSLRDREGFGPDGMIVPNPDGNSDLYRKVNELEYPLVDRDGRNAEGWKVADYDAWDAADELSRTGSVSDPGEYLEYYSRSQVQREWEEEEKARGYKRDHILWVYDTGSSEQRDHSWDDVQDPSRRWTDREGNRFNRVTGKDYWGRTREDYAAYARYVKAHEAQWEQDERNRAEAW